MNARDPRDFFDRLPVERAQCRKVTLLPRTRQDPHRQNTMRTEAQFSPLQSEIAADEQSATEQQSVASVTSAATRMPIRRRARVLPETLLPQSRRADSTSTLAAIAAGTSPKMKVVSREITSTDARAAPSIAMCCERTRAFGGIDF